MQKVLVLLFLVLPTFALADFSSVIGTSDGDWVSVDKKSIRKVGAYRKAWVTYITIKTEPPPRTRIEKKYLSYYDCVLGTSATFQSVTYSTVMLPWEQREDEKRISRDSWSYPFDAKEMRDVVPESIGAAELENVCNAKIN